MEQHDTRGGGIATDGLSRRRVLQLAGAGAAVGAFGLATGVASARVAGGCGELDLVIALDASSAMDDGSPTPLAGAKAGATALVEALGVSPAGAHVGVLTFDTTVTMVQSLTDDPAAATAAIEAIPDETMGLRNMEAAVQAAREELTGIDYYGDVVASGNDRPGAAKVLVLLSAGEPTASAGAIDDSSTFPDLFMFDPSEEAEAARTVDGIEIYTIGIAATALSADLLRDMASDPTDTHAFPNVPVDGIEAAFDAVAGDLCVSGVAIDVRPGSDTNPINCRSGGQGLVPVAVLGSEAFDVATLDRGSLRFGSRAVVTAGGGASLAHDGHLEDVNDDGYTDLVCHFPADEAGFVAGDEEAVLVGESLEGEPVVGTDAVTLVGKC